MRSHRFLAGVVAVVAAVALTACGSDSEETPAAGGSAAPAGDTFPVTVTHALGTTTIPAKPVRVATVAWANHEVPLALGIVPVGLAKANFADEDGDGYLPWASDKIKELGGAAPVLFDETDGIDFEAVANTQPDVILAAYSGLTQQDYDTLSQIAPTVAYPTTAWATPWRDWIKLESKALGLSAQGDALIADIEGQMKAEVAKYPALSGKSAMFMTHVDQTDLSKFSFYTTHDTRGAYFADLGLTTPPSIAELSGTTDQFALSVSAEQVDKLADVDIIVTYGDAEMVKKMQADPLLSKIPAVKRGSVVALVGTSTVGAAANPTPLSIGYVLKDYAKLLADAAAKVS
ncbi:iron complex transport system substrate-binding protein [Catenuloplanes nepalensis]|uniref:Iron complex transport system substrate-binding protein n=1 Tax=Catenuloplanes nepalensis TaxID=587533 RepID=A0ABT9MNV6_9ACTN|nr:iron-siderophore ABC transporter substrate-binding protein [Catenuloplanes nepalensis]MDP9792741.1 iron complex transport system substrate-binding protein [Catenuloplanes nepalensis]